MKKNIIEGLFLRQKPAKMLTFLSGDGKYVTEVSKFADCAYSHTIKILNMFRDFGLVVFERSGRVKIVKLTEMGQDVAHDLKGLLIKLSRVSGHFRGKKSFCHKNRDI